jgi:cytochrome c-type biogenesis protein CcmH/NrfG
MTAFAIILLCLLVAGWTLYPLIDRASDQSSGSGREADDKVAVWCEEKDRLVGEMVALDLAYAEKKINQADYEGERNRVMAEAEAAADELRRARAKAPVVAKDARTYPAIGGILAGGIVLGTVGLTLLLNGYDIRADGNPHADGRIPLTGAMAANGADGGTSQAQPGAASGAMPVDANGAPDVGAMVARLEAKVKSGKASVDETLMLARSYRVLGREDESLAMYRRAQAMAPDEKPINLVVASALLRSDKPADNAEAEKLVDKALAEDPSKPEALWLKSIGLIRRHEIQEAKDVLGRLQGLVKENSEAKTAVAGLLAELEGVKTPAAGSAPSNTSAQSPSSSGANPSSEGGPSQ